MDWTSNFLNTINGLPTSTTSTTHGIDPATRLPLPPVPLSTSFDLDTAVSAARTAFKSWSRKPWADRANAVKKFTDLLAENRDAIAKLVVMETSKPMMMAGGEVDSCVRWIRQVAQMELKEEVLEDSEARKVVCRWTALGVVGGILSWNFPATLVCAKVGPAAITGNVIIIKPSPFTPYTALKIVEIAQAAFPPGVVQCLSGSDDLGPAMTLHPGIDKIAFTGSIVTGKKIMESASKTLKRVTLELGGNDAAIVCKSVDIAKAAPSIATMAIVNSGQVCLAIKRVYIHAGVYQAFKEALISVIKSFKIGPGSEQGNFLGPIQNEMQYKRLKDMLADIKSKGYNVAIGNEGEADKKGFYINPTVVDRPSENSRIVTEEPFGPVFPILTWTDEDDVISRANDTMFGLGASVWTTDSEEGDRIARQLEAGSIWVNAHADMSAVIPVGGHKQSGLGVELGVEGLKDMCNIQTINYKKS